MPEQNDPTTDIVDRLNDPMMFLLVHMDVAAVAMMVALAGLMVGHLVLGMICSVFIAYYLQKFKSNHHRGYWKHLLYWHFPSWFLRLRSTPPSHIKEMIG
jgi:conjugal transfer pilus assembly protein TraL